MRDENEELYKFSTLSLSAMSKEVSLNLYFFFSVVEFWWQLRQATSSYFSRIASVIANGPGAKGKSSFRLKGAVDEVVFRL